MPIPARVVILNDSSIAKGGATGLATRLAQALAQRGVPVTFIAGDAGDGGAMAADGVDLVALGGSLLLDSGAAQAMRRGIFNTATRDAIANWIAAHDTPETVYHVHGWSRILSPSVFAALRPVATRTFAHAHDFFLACPNGAYYDFRKHVVCQRAPLSLSCLATQCDRRGYHHKLWRSARGASLKRHFGAAPWARIFMLHPGMKEPLARGGLPVDRLETLRNPAQPLTAQRVKAEENRTFCFIGRVESGKGINTLCSAARLAGLPLRVIGDGAETDMLRTAYPEVTFTGWVNHAEIGRHLADARALVMPSRTPEPFGLVAAEAALSGLPVILSRQSLLSTDIAQNGLGFATDPGSPQTLAESLRKVADLPGAEIRAMSDRGHAGAAGIAMDPNAWVDALMHHYQEAFLHG